MPNEALPNKREVMLALLAETSVFVHLDPRSPTVRVPPWFKNQPQLVLQIGLNMAVPIPDLDVNDHGIDCTLSFSRRPFPCSIPWSAVFGLVGDNGPGLVWPDDVPAEIAAQVQAQTQAQKVPSKKTAAKEAPRARLRAVGSEPPTPEQSAAAKLETPRPTPAPAPMLVAVPTEQTEREEVRAEKSAQEQQAQEPAQQSSAESEQAEPEKPTPARKPGSKATSKRELPPYLRVVK